MRLLRRMENGVAIRMVYTEVDADDADVRGGEPVFDGDKVIGVTTSGGYGYAVNKSLAFAYVDEGYESDGTCFEYGNPGKTTQSHRFSWSSLRSQERKIAAHR